MKGLFLLCFLGCLFFSACHKSNTLFTSLSASKTGIDFENKPLQKPLFGILYYLYFYKGHFQFEDITVKAGVAGTSDWCTGVTMADVNGDGKLDIYVCAVANAHGLKGHNELFINNGNNTFTESAAHYGLDFSGFTSQAAFFDYDHDGDLDC